MSKRNKLVKIYTRPGCEDCQSLKEFLSEDQIPYSEVDITESPERLKQLELVTGAKIVPAILIEKTNMAGKKKQQVFTGFTNNREKVERIIK